jgi:hypothetical protein
MTLNKPIWNGGTLFNIDSTFNHYWLGYIPVNKTHAIPLIDFLGTILIGFLITVIGITDSWIIGQVIAWVGAVVVHLYTNKRLLIAY